MSSRRGRSRIARQVDGESRALSSDEDVEQQSVPLRRHARQTEVEDVTRQIGEMELVLARFQRMNPPTFTGAEGGMMAEGCLLAEPLGSLAFLVQVSRRRSRREVEFESAAMYFINRLFGAIKMSGRGRGRNIPVDESSPDSNASIAQLLRLLVEQQGRGNGQSSSSRGPNNDDPQERFRRQKPREFSGTTDPFVAKSWIKSMEVIFEYFQTPDLERSRRAI
ncbi:hypothetical protein F511_19302 [Dorcoceras hygrometricum]|uniref:Uncharacterized protein n=1 Tax=Dorcoceras hygrometricum TaxID=472368 RepID=A0A2Z7CR49_9LAMI|nr:hypothetical protein F511_19302 [Dorcoceras hygrometricum]